MLTSENLHFDVVVLGGGVAGLWLLNVLVKEGYNAVLLEQNALGSGQTVASQGMIHGGVKYTLAGALSGASEAIADMPDVWRRCISGEGLLDLSQTNVLSKHFYMWSTDSALSKVTGFFASKALRGRINKLNKQNYPAVFSDARFKGNIYQLLDSVIDAGSLLKNLASNCAGRVFKANINDAVMDIGSGKLELTLKDNNQETKINASQFILAAGKGNHDLLNRISASSPLMQVRPLRQVMVKHNNKHHLYAHCIGSDSTPRLTISSHVCRDGSFCWYLGGKLAEEGVDVSPDKLLSRAKNELVTLFPWLEWQDAKWATLDVDRAEPRQKDFIRPDKSFIGKVISDDRNNNACENVSVVWPTKLTLAPNLGIETLTYLQQLSIKPGFADSRPEQLSLPAPDVCQPPWETISDQGLWKELN